MLTKSQALALDDADQRDNAVQTTCHGDNSDVKNEESISSAVRKGVDPRYNDGGVTTNHKLKENMKLGSVANLRKENLELTREDLIPGCKTPISNKALNPKLNPMLEVRPTSIIPLICNVKN